MTSVNAHAPRAAHCCSGDCCEVEAEEAEAGGGGGDELVVMPPATSQKSTVLRLKLPRELKFSIESVSAK